MPQDAFSVGVRYHASAAVLKSDSVNLGSSGGLIR